MLVHSDLVNMFAHFVSFYVIFKTSGLCSTEAEKGAFFMMYFSACRDGDPRAETVFHMRRLVFRMRYTLQNA